MTEILHLLKNLISAPGLSGNEEPVRQIIAETWRPLVDELSISPLGSLHALRRGRGPDPRPSILLAAHMDAIGLMVTGIVDGYLQFTQVGGVDHRILPGTRVIIHGREPLPGVVVMPSPRQLPEEMAEAPVSMQYLFVDTGRLQSETEKLVRVGDLISFAQEPLELSGETLAGHTLDNRAAVAVVTVCLQEIQHMLHSWDIWAVATVQEEVTLGGAFTSTFQIHPSTAVAIDVTFAKGPGSNDYNCVPLGKGCTLVWGPNVHPAWFKKFKEIAELLEIPYKVEYAPRFTGTDGHATQIVAEGIPTLVLGIPLRYMHTPVELVCMKDIQRAGRLLAEVITRLEPDYVAQIKWDEKTDESKE